MSIGDVKIKTGRSLPQQANIAPGMFGEGVAKAVSNFGAALGDVATITARLYDRQSRTEEFETRKKFLEHEGIQNRLQEEEMRNVTPGAVGITNAVQERVKANNQAFLESVPKRLQPEYTTLLEQLHQGQVNKAFTFEYEEGNKLTRQNVTVLTDDQATKVRTGELDLATAQDNLLETIKLTDLPEREKEIQIASANQALLVADYARATTASLMLEQPVRDVQLGKAEPDVVLSGTGPGMRGLANMVAQGESGSRYDVRYDGTTTGAPVTDFSDHPRVFVPLNDGTGRVSSAAGKYQITATTWDMAASELGLTDFSPASQDKAFAWLVEQRFNKIQDLKGLSFEDAITSGDEGILELVHEALKPEWEYLKTVPLEKFIQSLQGVEVSTEGQMAVPGVRAGAVGTPDQPDLWNDPKYADLTYAQKAAMYADTVIKTKQQHAAMKAAEKEQHTAQYNSAVMDASAGFLSLADEAALKQAGVLKTYPEVTAFRKAIDDWKTRVSTATELQAKFDNPNHVFTGSEDKVWNNLLGEPGKEKLGAMDQGYLNTALSPVVQRIGYIPSDSAKVLETMVATGTPQQREFALEALSTYHGQNPQLLERTTGLSDGMKKTIGQYTMLKPFYSQSEITEKFKQLRDPMFAKQHAELVGDGRKSFRADVTTSDMLNAFDSVFVSEPVLPLTAGQQNVFRQEFETLYAEGWALNPDKDTATEYASKQMLRQWSVSTIGGENRMMRNAPESYYPTINEDHSWMDYIARRDLGLTSDAEFSLVADGQTRGEAIAFQRTGEGNNASYMIGIKDAEGNYGLKMNELGTAPLRIAFDPNDPELTEDINWVTSYSNLSAKVNDSMMRISELRRQVDVNPAEIEMQLELVREQMDSATAMRESKVMRSDNKPAAVTRRLVADMEAEAQSIYSDSIFGIQSELQSPFLKEYYDKLVGDIKRLNGRVPGEKFDPAVGLYIPSNPETK